MQIAVPQPTQWTPRADFRPEEFARVLQGHGAALLWEQAELCPCGVSTPSRAHHAGCPVCNGVGWHWRDGQTIRGLVTSMTDSPSQFDGPGLLTPGTAFVTVPWEQQPGLNDRYTLVEGAMLYQEIRQRVGTTDRLTFPILSRTAALLVNGLTQAATLSVRYLRVQAAGGVGGDVLTLGTDFAVTTAGLLDWTLGVARGTAPAVGGWFAISYYASPRYVVVDHPFALRQKTQMPTGVTLANQSLPVKSLCKLDWHGGYGGSA